MAHWGNARKNLPASEDSSSEIDDTPDADQNELTQLQDTRQKVPMLRVGPGGPSGDVEVEVLVHQDKPARL